MNLRDYIYSPTTPVKPSNVTHHEDNNNEVVLSSTPLSLEEAFGQDSECLDYVPSNESSKRVKRFLGQFPRDGQESDFYLYSPELVHRQYLLKSKGSSNQTNDLPTRSEDKFPRNLNHFMSSQREILRSLWSTLYYSKDFDGMSKVFHLLCKIDFISLQDVKQFLNILQYSSNREEILHGLIEQTINKPHVKSQNKNRQQLFHMYIESMALNDNDTMGRKLFQLRHSDPAINLSIRLNMYETVIIVYQCHQLCHPYQDLVRCTMPTFQELIHQPQQFYKIIRFLHFVSTEEHFTTTTDGHSMENLMNAAKQLLSDLKVSFAATIQHIKLFGAPHDYIYSMLYISYLRAVNSNQEVLQFIQTLNSKLQLTRSQDAMDSKASDLLTPSNISDDAKATEILNVIEGTSDDEAIHWMENRSIHRILLEYFLTFTNLEGVLHTIHSTDPFKQPSHSLVTDSLSDHVAIGNELSSKLLKLIINWLTTTDCNDGNVLDILYLVLLMDPLNGFTKNKIIQNLYQFLSQVISFQRFRPCQSSQHVEAILHRMQCNDTFSVELRPLPKLHNRLDGSYNWTTWLIWRQLCIQLSQFHSEGDSTPFKAVSDDQIISSSNDILQLYPSVNDWLIKQNLSDLSSNSPSNIPSDHKQNLPFTTSQILEDFKFLNFDDLGDFSSLLTWSMVESHFNKIRFFDAELFPNKLDNVFNRNITEWIQFKNNPSAKLNQMSSYDAMVVHFENHLHEQFYGVKPSSMTSTQKMDDADIKLSMEEIQSAFNEFNDQQDDDNLSFISNGILLEMISVIQQFNDSAHDRQKNTIIHEYAGWLSGSHDIIDLKDFEIHPYQISIQTVSEDNERPKKVEFFTFLSPKILEILTFQILATFYSRHDQDSLYIIRAIQIIFLHGLFINQDTPQSADGMDPLERIASTSITCLKYLHQHLNIMRCLKLSIFCGQQRRSSIPPVKRIDGTIHYDLHGQPNVRYVPSKHFVSKPNQIV